MYNKGINTHLRYQIFTKNIGYFTSSSTLLKCPPLVNIFNVIQKNDYQIPSDSEFSFCSYTESAKYVSYDNDLLK